MAPHMNLQKIKNKLFYRVKIVLTLFSTMFFLSCAEPIEQNDKEVDYSDTLHSVILQQDADNGKMLFLKNCFGCHSQPVKESEPDIRSLLIYMPIDSINAIIEFTLDSKNSNRKGGNILKSFQDRGKGPKFYHSFKDSLSRDDVRKIVIYSWLASQPTR